METRSTEMDNKSSRKKYDDLYVQFSNHMWTKFFLMKINGSVVILGGQGRLRTNYLYALPCGPVAWKIFSLL